MKIPLLRYDGFPLVISYVMKLNYEQTIDASLATVWAAFDNPANIGRWQHNFQSFTHKSGEAGQPGAISELVFNEKGKMIVVKETIMERREPDFMSGTYESEYGTTIVVNHFAAIDANATRWTSWCKFTFKGFMRFLTLFIAGSIRKRTEADMHCFKLMVETDEAGRAQ